MTGVDSWDIVVHNIGKLSANSVYYGLGMTVYEENIEEIPLLAKFAWEKKASFIRFTPVVSVRQGQGLKWV